MDPVPSPAPMPSPAPTRAILDHPRGLWVLAGTEMWDRVSFHGMQALLVLYMVGALLLPGHVEAIAGFAAYRHAVESVTGPLSVEALATQTFGLYTGLIFFTPLLGGAIGDRIGRRAGVISGGVLMAAGHFAMMFDRSFLLALGLLIVGAGLFRGNLLPQVKSLYADGDRREGDAFQLYYAAINVGAVAAPLITGTLAQVYGWHVGFGFAGVGMVIGVIAYLAGMRLLPPDPARSERAQMPALDRAERRRVVGIFVLTLPLVCFWTAQSQVWNVYNLWVRDHVDLMVGGFTMPVPWLQSLDSLVPLGAVPVALWAWRRQAARGREPDAVTKIAIGCLLFALSTAWLAAAPVAVGADGRVPLWWAVVFHLGSNIGWLFAAPIAMALYGTMSPAKYRGTLMGMLQVNVFIASVISGRLGGLYEKWSPTRFWLLHAGIAAAGGVLLLAGARPVRRLLAPGDLPGG